MSKKDTLGLLVHVQAQERIQAFSVPGSLEVLVTSSRRGLVCLRWDWELKMISLLRIEKWMQASGVCLAFSTGQQK